MSLIRETAPRIALVEDEPSHALLIHYNLELRGMNVSLFESGEKFLNESQQHYDLIIINGEIFDINGLHLCSQIKGGGITTPILFVTTNPRLDNSCCKLEQVEYILKPFSIKDLVSKVDQALSHQCIGA
ncbi:response regulator [Alkalihalobacillus sp. MEB130]|uniref:response regulator transcription factor n=1 Tax=Alkalihalobacillus sp. MEB130 TaxID=2976704 RepID=UPI0028DF36CF|nr:response regulator [Alkalihalobacillus sp. MEB130]MDT8859557.1 response regulator [Alkalihalobacillus sp. MEB130]